MDEVFERDVNREGDHYKQDVVDDQHEIEVDQADEGFVLQKDVPASHGLGIGVSDEDGNLDWDQHRRNCCRRSGSSIKRSPGGCVLVARGAI